MTSSVPARQPPTAWMTSSACVLRTVWTAATVLTIAATMSSALFNKRGGGGEFIASPCLLVLLKLRLAWIYFFDHVRCT